MREAEFKKIYEEFHTKILRYMGRLIGAHEAKDLSQEIFLKISRAMKTFRSESKLSTWIYRIATNTALDRLRSPNYKRAVPETLTLGDGGRETEDVNFWTGDKTAPLDQQLIRKEMNKCIREIVEGLPEDYRIVLVLSEFEGLKNREIAQILGMTLDAVKIRLHRARDRMKKELEGHCSFYRDERNELACDRKPVFIKFS